MWNRWLISVLLCLVVITAHTHCVMAHGDELLQEVVQAQWPAGLTPFSTDEPTCENESSCICKGVILVEHTAVPSDATHCCDLLSACPADALLALGTILPHPRLVVAQTDLAQPLPSGPGARARLQSFQL